MEVFLISLGGAVGAVARYAVGQRLRTTAFPWATLIVNALGSFILGLVLFSDSTTPVQVLVGVGFCGAFTTFSSFSFQTVSLWDRGKRRQAVVNATGNLGLSLFGITVAWLLLA